MCVFSLCRKDPSAFFSFPVTDLIAPGYSAVIKRPMDFSTMKDKVKKECYQSLDELKVSVYITHRCIIACWYTHTHTAGKTKIIRDVLSQSLGLVSGLVFDSVLTSRLAKYRFAKL